MGKKTALLIMDFQNDIVTKEGIGSEDRCDMARMAGPVAKIPRLIQFGRERGQEVIFVRFLGDKKYQLPNWMFRDKEFAKNPKCLEGTWGADIFPTIQPEAAERVFSEKAHFDAFLCPRFEQYLLEQGLEHLIFVGVYCNVCVDSTARTGYQKGYFITVVSDCTTTLHLPEEESLR